MKDKLLRESLRVQRGLVGGAHPMAVIALRVWPSARPDEARDVRDVPRENPVAELDPVRHVVVRG